MEAIGVLLAQLGGGAMGGGERRTDGLNQNRHRLQGTFSEIQLLFRGLNVLLVVLVIIVVVLSISAILLDWAYFYSGISIDHANTRHYQQSYSPHTMGSTFGVDDGFIPPVLVKISRGDGLQVTILKAVISSVIGFFIVQLLKMSATPKNVSRLGSHSAKFSATYHGASAFLAARRSMICFVSAAIVCVASVSAFIRGYTVVCLSFTALTSMFVWAGATYGHTSQQELFMTLNIADTTPRGIYTRASTHTVASANTDSTSTSTSNQIEDSPRIHLVVAGMVNAGKTSLVKAMLNIKPDDTSELAQSLVVGYGNTAEKSSSAVRVERDKGVVLYDLRGENMMNGTWTNGAPEEMDIGIFVVEGSANTNHQQLYRDLRERCKKVFVVRTKADVDMERLKEEAKRRLMDQWKEVLGVELIYITSVRGFDPMKEEPVYVSGLDELLKDMSKFLEANGKDILLARYQKEKERAATNIIVKAGSKVMLGDNIHSVERKASEQLHYLYTGSWNIIVYPPEIHPVVSLSTKVISYLPVVGAMSNQLVGASTMVLQLMALAHGLRCLDEVPGTPTENVQSATNVFASTVNLATVREVFEKISIHGPAVYEAGEEYFFDNIASLLVNGVTRPSNQRRST
eukprot:CFRG5976T1